METYLKFCPLKCKSKLSSVVKISHLNIVIVASADLTYGMGRMFEMLSDITNITVVRNIIEALEMLGINEMSKIFENEQIISAP